MSPSEIAFRTSGRSSYMSANPCSRVTVIVVDDMPGSPVMCERVCPCAFPRVLTTGRKGLLPEYLADSLAEGKP